jgi:hypothetical protein
MALIVLVAEITLKTVWLNGFSPTPYGSTVSHPYHHHIPTGTIAGINGNRGNDVNADFPNGWAVSATEIGQYSLFFGKILIKRGTLLRHHYDIYYDIC